MLPELGLVLPRYWANTSKARIRRLFLWQRSLRWGTFAEEAAVDLTEAAVDLTDNI